MNKETIAAIATALSESGIGIIRVSGDDAIDIVNRIFVSKKKDFQLTDAKSHTIHYCHCLFKSDCFHFYFSFLSLCYLNYTTRRGVCQSFI